MQKRPSLMNLIWVAIAALIFVAGCSPATPVDHPDPASAAQTAELERAKTRIEDLEKSLSEAKLSADRNKQYALNWKDQFQKLARETVADRAAMYAEPSSMSGPIGSLPTAGEGDGDDTPGEPTSDDHYTNVDGQEVHSPSYTDNGQPPAGASAECWDGTYSFSQNRRGTCSRHGGVKRWL